MDLMLIGIGLSALASALGGLRVVQHLSEIMRREQAWRNR